MGIEMFPCAKAKNFADVQMRSKGCVRIYDDVMEHLRIRYVITYVPDGPARDGARHAVRVELIDRNGGPLRIVDEAGRPVAARVIAQTSYES